MTARAIDVSSLSPGFPKGLAETLQTDTARRQIDLIVTVKSDDARSRVTLVP